MSAIQSEDLSPDKNDSHLGYFLISISARSGPSSSLVYFFTSPLSFMSYYSYMSLSLSLAVSFILTDRIWSSQ